MIDEVKRLVDLGLSQRQIAKRLNVNRDKIKNILIKNNIKTIHKVCVVDENKFKEQFNQYYKNRFEYVKGYVNKDTSVVVKCLKCNETQLRYPSALRSKSNMECDNCNKLIKQSKLNIKQKELENKQLELQKKIMQKEQDKLNKCKKFECTYCGKEFKNARSNSKFCSIECRNKQSNKERETKRKNRLKMNGKYDWNISIPKLIKRDKVCKICGKEVDLLDIVNAKGTMIAGDNYPSIDHIIPVSKGGTHTWDNVQLAHRHCNTKKRDNTNVIVNVGSNQLMLNV